MDTGENNSLLGHNSLNNNNNNNTSNSDLSTHLCEIDDSEYEQDNIVLAPQFQSLLSLPSPSSSGLLMGTGTMGTGSTGVGGISPSSMRNNNSAGGAGSGGGSANSSNNNNGGNNTNTSINNSKMQKVKWNNNVQHTEV